MKIGIIPEETIKAILKLNKDGLGRAPICKALQVSERTVRNVLKDAGIDNSNRLSEKVALSDDDMEKLFKLDNDGYGARYIAKELEISRPIVRRILNAADIKNSDRKRMKVIHLYTEKKCGGPCEQIKDISCFYKRVNEDGELVAYASYCLDCEKVRAKQYVEDNYEKVVSKQKEYREDNKEIIAQKYNVWFKDKKKSDPAFKLRKDISSIISSALAKVGTTKLGGTCMSYIDYSMEELKIHIENQFEPWMTWENRGKYDPKTWSDNDPSTWKWQLDHIEAQYKFDFNNYDDVKRCWQLSNLRPYGAKLNILDGVNRIERIKEEDDEAE